MVIRNEILRLMSFVDNSSVGEKIHCDPLLHQYISTVFLIPKHPVHRIARPLGSSRSRLHLFSCQVRGDLVGTIAIQELPENPPYRLSLLLIYDQVALSILVVSQKGCSWTVGLTLLESLLN